ncbi:MAG: YiiG family protein [Planctomycetes bacterium]|nr:YiiG family protein [Planctomycetota bacterium]
MSALVRFASVLCLVPLAMSAASAAPTPPDAPDPAAFLKAAHAKHADLTAAGLQSFKARVKLRRSDDDNVMLVRDSAAFTYSFTAPDREEFDFQDTMEVLRKPLRDSLTGLWRETTGAVCFPAIEGAEGLALESAPPLNVLTGTAKAGGAFRVSFDAATDRVLDATFADTVKRAWTHEFTPKGFQVRGIDVSVGDKSVYVSTYDVFRDVRGFQLPTVVRLTANGKSTEFQLEYQLVNDRVATPEPLDAAAIKAKVDEFEKGWKGFDEATKAAKLREVGDLESDLASAAVAKLGLKDASLDIREKAAVTLGLMKRPNVVAALVVALAANEKEIRVYLKVIEALGDIGDPRAVDPISKDWWNQRIGEYALAAAKAKIAALGKIRDASAVDALLETFTITSEDRMGALRPDIIASLTKLTDQKFGPDRKAWAEWWKKARSSFRF